VNTNGKELTPAPTVGALEAYATSETPFYGDLLRFSGKDGLWTAGQQGLTVDRGTILVAIVPEMMAGYVKWGEGGLIDQRLVPVAAFSTREQRGALRAALDDQDREEWDLDKETGRRKDPWQECAWLPMISSETKAKYTYSTSSYGGRAAIKNLVGAYAEQKKAAKGTPMLPVVELQGDKHPAKVKAHGMIHDPLLNILDWITPAEAFGTQEPELEFAPDGEDPPPTTEIPPEPDPFDPEPVVTPSMQAAARKRARV
jgi:hypothetical protein